MPMLTRAQAKLIRKLRSRKRREKERSFLAEGVRLVEELLSSGLDVELIVSAPALSATPRGRRLQRRLEAGSWNVAETSDSELGGLADTESPQGVLAVARKPSRTLTGLEVDRGSAVLIFDRVADPGNLGTLVRTAHALGVSCAVALPGTADPWGPKAARASAGSLFRLPVCEAEWPEVLTWLRRLDLAIFCADPGGEPVSRRANRSRGFALVLGNEPSGVSAQVSRECDRRVAVALPGGMDSLNVAVAGALLLDRLLTDSISRG